MAAPATAQQRALIGPKIPTTFGGTAADVKIGGAVTRHVTASELREKASSASG